jgi:hypothetical protein
MGLGNFVYDVIFMVAEIVQPPIYLTLLNRFSGTGGLMFIA